ncbi:hypothetical protein L3X38_002348 [Prunus dulcis]|uniref:RNA-directed DNA polymerase n=1 Tax=Prunus dulcis TaxID=3755 RepID=A0AAD4ZL05_PRUDU|nr:hypothetical protein L3X38_002348 [Prunus dulcis]
MQPPSEDHMRAVTRILRYLKVTSGKGLMFSKYGHTDMEGYTDADWASSATNRHSMSGYFTFVGRNLVTWRSKKQKVVSRSSAEAEYRGMGHGVCELLWLRRLLRDLGFGPKKPRGSLIRRTVIDWTKSWDCLGLVRIGLSWIKY